MFITDVKRVVEQISRDKGIDGKILFKALEEALRSAARKKFGSKVDVEVNYNMESGEIEVFQFKEVVEEIIDVDSQISFEDGIMLDPDCELGDSLGSKIDVSTFGRIAVQSAKQVIIQKLKDAERDAVYSGYIDRKGEIINGIVQRIDRGNIIVNLGITDAILRLREQIPGEVYTRGDRIRALIVDILYDTRGPQIILSRAHSDFLINLFKTEVPEITEGLIDVRGAAREAGSRAKFAVVSNDSDIDPVGSCVGMKGSRVQNVVQELKGEKIDVIMWHLDPAKYVCNALSPAEVTRVIIDEENHSMEVFVFDEFLSVAIGKKGQNVRLASKLTGWKLDVCGESSYDVLIEKKNNLVSNLSGIKKDVAKLLLREGISSVADLASTNIDFLKKIDGIEGKVASHLIDVAKVYLSSLSESLKSSRKIKYRQSNSEKLSKSLF